MSDSAAPGTDYKIPIGHAIGRACRVSLQNLQPMIRFAWLPFAFVAAVIAIFYVLPSPEVRDHPYLWSAQLLVTSMIELLVLIISVMWFLARWFRFALLAQHSTEIFPQRGSPFVKAATKIGAFPFLGFVGLNAVTLAHLVINIGMFSDVLCFLLIVGVPFFAIEISLILPAAVIGQPLTLSGAWALLAGNHVRLFASMMAIFLPFLIVEGVIEKIKQTSSFPILGSLVSSGVSLALCFIFAVVAAVLLSEVYRGVSGTAANRVAPAG